MDKKELLLKWLEGSLDTVELQAFQELEEYPSYVKLYENAVHFKSPKVDKLTSYIEFKSIIEKQKAPRRLNSWVSSLLKIAAVFILISGIYFTFFKEDLSKIKIKTLMAESIEVKLPDASIVQLNDGSTLRYNEEKWENNKRRVRLNGEAFFKVAKGATFKVKTKMGLVTVLGTEFNVKQRKNYFEVICYEGTVIVKINNVKTELHAGETISILNGELRNGTTSNLYPTWIEGKSSFKSIPYKHVLDEFERQYNVTITVKNVNIENFFTGSFVHNNKELALKSITQPFKLDFSLNGKSIEIGKYN